MARVDSSDPDHRETIRKQQEARKKKAPPSGEANKSFTTDSGRQMDNPSRTRDRIVTVRGHDGNPYKTTESAARKDIESGKIPQQDLE